MFKREDEIKPTQLDTLLGDTNKCCDCGKDFFPNQYGNSDVRGRDCHYKFNVMNMKQLADIEVDANALLLENPNLIIDTSETDDVCNSLFQIGEESLRISQLTMKTRKQIKHLNELMKSKELKMYDLLLYTNNVVNDQSVSDLATSMLHFSFAKSMNPEFLMTLDTNVRIYFSNNTNTNYQSLVNLSEDKNNIVATNAKKTLSIIKLMNKK